MFQQLYGFQSAPFARTLNTGDVLATPCVKELHGCLCHAPFISDVRLHLARTLTLKERGGCQAVLVPQPYALELLPMRIVH